MAPIDLPLIAIWSVAAISFAWLSYLFATWPSANQRNTVNSMPPRFDIVPERGWRTASASKRASAQPLPTWEAPSEAALDGILSKPSELGNVRRGTKNRVRAPVTLKHRIVRAGIYRKNGIWTFHLIRAGATLSMLCSGLLIVPLTSLPWIFALYIGVLGGLAGYLFPSFWLDRQLRIRQTKMRRTLPDALDLITVCIQGGLSLPAALARVARELGSAHKMLATELSIVEREIQMGRGIGEAMLQFAQRFNLEELRSLASVVGQTEKYGGSIAGALKTYAEGLRIKRRQRAEEMAQKAAVKLLFPTLLCIFPGIFVVVLGPTAMRMYQVMTGVTWHG